MTRRSDETALTPADLRRINTVLQQIAPAIDSELRAAARGKTVRFNLMVWNGNQAFGIANFSHGEVRRAMLESLGLPAFKGRKA
ncbi:MAG: hypothetical protein COW55_01830 [Rhodobacteraceae bacterium CG17_big_fil_post_rev_8_21_14_2_50_65_11]|nr:MAG: hypothetical protein COW55_01830 [Rhodobacteraceae bacterium CG17_big_fil_post_rev_8_21_14_2_50_65_11]